MATPSTRRTLLGSAVDLGNRQRVYETAEAVVVDEANGISGRRTRVFYDEVVLVTFHEYIGWALVIVMGCLAFVGVGTTVLLAVGKLVGAAVAAGLMTLVLLGVMVARLVAKVQAITVYGRRSRARVTFWLRGRRARATFSRLCARVLHAQERPAAPPAPSPLPAPGPPEVAS